MKKIITLFTLVFLVQMSFGQALNETFDDASGFTSSEAFFSDGGGDFYGLGGVGDWGAGSAPSGLKAYTGFSGGFLTGMDLDGDGATVPIVVDWTGIDISGLASLEFSGDFAEFFDSPGDIDAANDIILVQYQIDGGGYQNLIAFEGDESNGNFNGNFSEDTNFDGIGDGTVLTGTAETFIKSIAGTGTTLDLRLTVSVDAGDEDFAVDNFIVSGLGSGNPPSISCPMDITVPNDAGVCSAVVNFTDPIAFDPEDGVIPVTQTAGPTSGSMFPVGTTVVTYEATDSDNNTVSCSFNVIVEDTEAPVAVCQDITVELDANGMYTMNAAEIDGGSTDNCGVSTLEVSLGGATVNAPVGLYALIPGFVGAPSNLGRYDYDPVTDAITLVDDPYGDTSLGNSVHIDYNPVDGQVYLIADSPTTFNRALFEYDLDTNTLGAELGDLVSAGGGGNANSMVFAPDGTLYVSFSNGQINTLDIGTMTTSAFTTVPSTNGAMGLAYDYDNDEIIYVTGFGSITDLYSIDLAGTATLEFSFAPCTGAGNGTAQAMEYLGGGKMVVSGTGSCNTIYTIDLNTQTTNVILNPDGFEGVIKSLLYVPAGGGGPAAPSITFTCDDVGMQMVDLIVTDAAGNQSTCTATVTVEDNTAPEIICVGEASGPSVFINEIHYDNTGADQDEAIEVAGPAGTDLSTYSLVLYNGNGGAEYNTVALSGTIDDEGSGYGAVNFAISGIQNGAPDGIVLAQNGNVIQFLSYEGSFTAVGGVADGMTSTDIGVFEPGSTPIGESLQLTGTGTYYPDFTWMGPMASSPGDLNAGQTIQMPTSAAYDVVLDANGMATVNASDLVVSVTEACDYEVTVAGGAPMPGDLTTTFAGGSGIRSPMFDVNILSDMTINTFDVNLDDGAVMDIEIYAKLGTHVGSENNPGDWTLLETVTGVVSAGDGLPTPLNLSLNYQVNAGETHAFYIASDDKVAGAGFNYTVGTAVGDLFASDANMEILEGASVSYPFGTVFSPRIFNGTIYYNTGGAGTPNPTIDFDCSNVGENQVEVTVTDASGNTATCVATVNVIDETDPILVCQDITIELDENGMATIVPEDLLASTPTTYNAMVIGSDNASGTAGETDFEVNVTANETISFDWDYTTNDIPGFDSFGYVLNGTYNQLTDDLLGNQSGNTTVNLTAGDVFAFRVDTDDNGFGNSETIITNFQPGFTGQFAPANWTVVLNNSDGDAFFIEIPGGPLSFDACGISVLAVDIDEFSCDDIGTPVTVTVFASDPSGNLASCTSVVTVVDLLGPEVTCPADQTVDPGPNNLFYVLPDYFDTGEATAADNCTDPLTIFSQDPAPGTLLSDGVYTISLCSTDEYGNEGCCTFELTVESVLGNEDNALASGIKLYPNPADQWVTLGNQSGIQLEAAMVFDMNGRLVMDLDLSNMGTERQVDVSALASGVYMVQIAGEGQSTVKRLIKR